MGNTRDFFCADGDNDGLELGKKLIQGDVLADLDVATDLGAHGFNDADLGTDDIAWQAVFGHANV
jgi:hypothetical protein